jgi:hypothetical protein
MTEHGAQLEPNQATTEKPNKSRQCGKRNPTPSQSLCFCGGVALGRDGRIWVAGGSALGRDQAGKLSEPPRVSVILCSGLRLS